MTPRMPGHSATVLVIDDEPGTLSVITDTLEGAGITVLVSTSGEAALDLLGRFLPDLIIVDAVMPGGIDGFETTERIKRNPRLANIPVIFMTGLTESEHVVEAFEVGGVDYVRKPVNLVELLARVRVHMAQGRAAHASAASLDATGRLMLATNSTGSLLWCTPMAEEAISRVVPGWSRQQSLPPEVRVPVERLLLRGAAGASIRFEQAAPGGMLELVLVTRYRENEVLIRLNELNPGKDVDRLAHSLSLTRREAEVLLWVSYGKSSSDISEVLEISPRTVQKHLEHVYEKLGVETRSAAAAMAIRVIEQ
jgi:DNA-binding NarL/FixJ family response regulator